MNTLLLKKCINSEGHPVWDVLFNGVSLPHVSSVKVDSDWGRIPVITIELVAENTPEVEFVIEQLCP